MPIAFCFMDDEGFLWEYLGNNTYSSEQALSIGDPGSPTINVAINSTSMLSASFLQGFHKFHGVISNNIISNGISCNTFVFSVLPPNCASDSAAATAGVPVGGIYMNAGVLMVRQT